MIGSIKIQWIKTFISPAVIIFPVIIIFPVVILLTCCLTACGPSPNQCPPLVERNPSLANLEQLEAQANNSRVSVMRMQALRDTALSVGARGGLSHRAHQINCILLTHEKLLFRVYNFNAMMLDKSVLPPVLLEARNTLKISGIDAIRIADRNYQILTQAKFVTAPPIWRDYLWMNYPTPETPDRSLLPRNQAERLVWKRYIDEGWVAGVQQANAIFRENIGRIKRDYEGMIRYRTLLAQNMVSPPFVAEMDLGVTGGCDDLTVNDRVLRITAFPCLQLDSKSWKTEIVPIDNVPVDCEE